MLWRLAWRNLWRNKTRTVIVVSAIAFSYGLMLFLFGITQDSYEKMGDNVVEAVGGHILIHGEGYWDLPTGGQVVEEPATMLDELRQMPEVDAVASRILGFGLLGTAVTSEGAQILGIRPEDEVHFADLESRLVEGELLGDERDMPVVIEADDADTLGVGIGDRLVVTASEIDGEVTRGLFFVDGILDGGPGQAGEGRAYVRFEDLQQLLGYGEGATQIGIRLYDDDQRRAVANRLREQGAGQDLEVLTWDEAVPEFQALIELDEAISFMYLFVILFIVVLGITNTFLMAVMERIREIGLLSALGLAPRRVGALVMMETTCLAFVGMTAGLGLGLMGHFWVSANGIDLSEVADYDLDVSGITMDMVVHSHLDLPLWIGGSVVVFIFICLAALYPAWRATRQAPAEAMRFYE